MRIHYTTEPIDPYMKGLSAADTLDKLVQHVELYRRVANDAFRIASALTGEEFLEWRTGLALERRKKFAGEAWCEKYGSILLPAVMFECGLMATQYHVPWGVAFIRMKDWGRIVEADGVATLQVAEQP